MRYSDVDRLGKEAPDSSQNTNDSLAEQKEWEKILNEAKIKISRHWARLGFKQHGRNTEECEALYSTSNTYFRNSSNIHSNCHTWKTKDETEKMDIYI